MKKFLVISAIALATFSAFCAGTKKFGKMRDSDWVVTNAWQAMQHRVKPDSEWATNHFGSAEFSNSVGKVQRKVDIPVKSVNGKTGDVILNASDVHALPDTYTPPEGMTDNALVLTNGAVKTKSGTTITPGNIGAASASDLGGKLDTFHPYNEEQPEYGLSLRWLDGYNGLAFGYYDDGIGFFPQIRISDTPYGEIMHVGHVDPDRPWSWITIGDSTDENTLQDALDAKADKYDISATNPTFSNAVLAVQISTNDFAALYALKESFDDIPIDPVTGSISIGALLAALASAVAWLKKNKVQTLKLEDGSVETSADGGVAKLDDFFTESNSLLNARITYERNTTGLKDRAFNTLTFDGTAYNLSTALAAVTPTASGQPRDLLIVATATATTTISFTAGTIKGDKPTIDGAGTWLITLTEYAANTWYCRQIKMEDAA